MSVSALKKKTLAQAAAAVVVVAVLGGGYVAPMCSYGTMVDQSRSFVENFINQHMIAEGNKTFSVDLYEDDFGLFSHDITFIATDGDVKIKIPVTISLNYGGYDFDVDLIHATINDANALKSFDLTTLTALELKGDFSLCSDKGNVYFKTSYLNDDVSLYALAEYQKYLREHVASEQVDQDEKPFPSFENGIEGAVEQLKERIAYKPVGTLSMQLAFDTQENFKTDLTVDHFLSNYAALSELSYHSETKGLTEIVDLGRNDLSLRRFALLGMAPMVAEDISLKSQSSRPNKQGIFDLAYEFKVGAARQLQNLNLTGKVSGLHLDTINNPEVILADLKSFFPQPMTISVDKGSRFDYVTLVRPDEYSQAEQKTVSVTVDGSEVLEVKEGGPYGDYLDIGITANVGADTDVTLICGRSLLPMMPLFEHFKVSKDGSSQGTIVYQSGRPDEPETMTVNGVKIE